MMAPCPWLPEVVERLDYQHTRRHGKKRGAEFYRDALCYAQSKWMAGKPAQAILQINKAWMAELSDDDEVDLTDFASPYRALVWILRHAAEGTPGFFGNPVRHFQHLATRMSGPRAEIRIWRAWVCFHLAEQTLPAYPRDGVQLCREGLQIPTWDQALKAVKKTGWKGEGEEIEAARIS